MLVGFNTNISYKDNVYHIQTEDSGKNNPVIVTLLYAKGAILSSKKTSYAQILQDPEFEEKVRKIMKAQHKSMIKDLLSGKYTGDYKDEAEAQAQTETKKEIQKEVKVQAETEAAAEKDEAITEATEAIIPGKDEQSEQAQKQEIPGESIQQQEAKEAKAQISKSLDDILLNYIMKRGK